MLGPVRDLVVFGAVADYFAGAAAEKALRVRTELAAGCQSHGRLLGLNLNIDERCIDRMSAW